ncbi:MAG: DUF3570 domain-containing protein [Nannocystaceae bacterium]
MRFPDLIISICTSASACLFLLCTPAYAHAVPRTSSDEAQARTRAKEAIRETLGAPLDPSDRTRAEKTVALRCDVYSDRWSTVISPAALARVRLGPRPRSGNDATFEVETDVELDAVSGATPVLMADTITSATPFDDRRHAGHITFSAQLEPTWTVATTANISIESDHRTYAASVSSSAELVDRHATISLSSGFFHEIAGRADDPDYAQRTLGAAATFGWAHLVARRTTFMFQLDGRLRACASQLGCQANPYRHVPVWNENAEGNPVLIAPAERHPDQRIRAATAVGLAQYLGAGVGLHLRYRYCGDTWRVFGHTARVAIAKELLGGKLVARLEARGTAQASAAFHRDQYSSSAHAPSVPEYRSADRELSRIRGLISGARVEYLSPITHKVRWRANARVQRHWYRYLDHSELPSRQAWLVGLGAGALF